MSFGFGFRRRRVAPQAHAFQDSSTGFKGWRIKLDSGQAVPTPAVANGRVFVGGGFGSYDFYALDALTGAEVWHLRTMDDGPTAATLAEGCVVFNTESCTLVVVEAVTGRLIWNKWLGDPLLAQPAVMDGRVFMVYPAKDGHHRLGAFTLKEDQPLWETRLDHDVITAPVVAEGKVHLATFDGTVWCIDPQTGRVHWSQQLQATSAPWVYEGDVYVAHREKAPRGPRQPGDDTRTRSAEAISAEEVPLERTSRYEALTGSYKYSSPGKRAMYLSKSSGTLRKALYAAADSSVGFAQTPSSAKLHTAAKLLGESLVSRAWRFQGSRPVVVNGILYETTGDCLEASDVRTGEALWSWRDAVQVEGERRLTPPAVANGRVWLGTWDGRLMSFDALTGEVRWSVKVGAPCHWQPVVSDGWIYAGLEDGSLVGLATGDALDTDWPMWGGGCGHNGKPIPEPQPDAKPDKPLLSDDLRFTPDPVMA